MATTDAAEHLAELDDLIEEVDADADGYPDWSGSFFHLGTRTLAALKAARAALAESPSASPEA